MPIIDATYLFKKKKPYERESQHQKMVKTKIMVLKKILIIMEIDIHLLISLRTHQLNTTEKKCSFSRYHLRIW